jgi:uncharacterized protein (TIGR03066 family)
MNIVRLSAVVVSCLALVLSASAEEKTNNKEKIVGTWELVKSEGGVPPGTTLEFTKDGKLTIKVKVEDKSITVSGTYAIDGDKLKTVVKIDDKETKETMTIKTLTDKSLVTLNEKKETDEFKKK